MIVFGIDNHRLKTFFFIKQLKFDHMVFYCLGGIASRLIIIFDEDDAAM